MDSLHVILVLLLGGHWISGSVVDLTVRSGENVTLNCDCEVLPEEYVVWYRNCTHENQPPLVLKLKEDAWKKISDRAVSVNSLLRFHFKKNQSSGSYDLLIMNISDSDEGLYYCGTEKEQWVDDASVQVRYDHRYASIATRILISSRHTRPCPDSSPCPDSNPHSDSSTRPDSTRRAVYSGTCGSSLVPWLMMFTPGFSILISFFSFIFIYQFCRKTEKELQFFQNRLDHNNQRKQNADEDLCLTQVWFQARNGHKNL
ncbi:unnamed protein product [Oreochromis niloticus]|nr:unnamed protein product [Mustela putorius furo]